MSQSFVNRAALGSLGLAVTAALLTAAITCGLAAVLLQRAEDRRLHEAAVVLGAELMEPGAQARLEAIVADEHAETTHMGLAFALFDLSGQRLAGDTRITFLPPGACALLTGDFRACSTEAAPLVVVAGGAHASIAELLLAALVASLLVAAGAFLVSRPLAKSVVAPLAELQTRLARLDAAAITHIELGPLSNVSEVDALRATIEVLLRRVDEALTQATRFASDAAHELRTPLSTIQGELDLLHHEAPSPAVVGRLRATVTRLSLLVERLLVLATPGGGAATELVSLRDVLEDTVAGLSAAERERVVLELTGDVSLRGDSALLSSMVSNALSNGLKFGHRVTARLLEDGLQFDDDGPGVPLDERVRVFEPLYRGQAARSARIAGHGLGLALIAHVARQHGGTAAFEDGAAGARLTVRFPT
ncbi:MAG: HAMP domain-containing sensor histidine kinase [Archangium sp.]|nr:HAMP domain-containing sensor histidine kinase [Archangium sp.]MDP3572165.1 HAMP domain-containing sensor histidine kinase [Archangium sp.]